ncbi:hypothetical protein PR202_ga00047 [Eleusine coracana subsp. coracana]|uniref:Uncharacterized protein n=1 Tax=Eleusine coracana subsp. coracana TaxID=191504 RepID=A0AAV5BF78_ELECO|nr:hypothetical protein PR202_ga00047 [Eleusine coracana subsp. coracana]
MGGRAGIKTCGGGGLPSLRGWDSHGHTHEWVKRGVHFGVRTAFTVFATNFDLAEAELEAVSTGYIKGHTPEQMDTIRAATHPHVDALAERYEEEALLKIEEGN